MFSLTSTSRSASVTVAVFFKNKQSQGREKGFSMSQDTTQEIPSVNAASIGKLPRHLHQKLERKLMQGESVLFAHQPHKLPLLGLWAAILVLATPLLLAPRFVAESGARVFVWLIEYLEERYGLFADILESWDPVGFVQGAGQLAVFDVPVARLLGALLVVVALPVFLWRAWERRNLLFVITQWRVMFFFVSFPFSYRKSKSPGEGFFSADMRRMFFKELNVTDDALSESLLSRILGRPLWIRWRFREQLRWWRRVHLDTAGVLPNVDLEAVPYPDRFEELITSLTPNNRQDTSFEEGRMREAIARGVEEGMKRVRESSARDDNAQASPS